MLNGFIKDSCFESGQNFALFQISDRHFPEEHGLEPIGTVEVFGNMEITGLPLHSDRRQRVFSQPVNINVFGSRDVK